MSTREIEFFFDIGSSYSYLAAHVIDALGQRTGTPVRWRPFLLGGVFKATGNDMPARIMAKARYMIVDMDRWAEQYGVPFEINSRFPLVTLRTMRVLAGVELEHPEKVRPMALALFRAMWAEDRDPTSDEVLREAARAGGLDPEATLALADAQPAKDRLRASSDEAVARGAFGAPTMFVGDQMFWGNDRLDHLERFLKKG